MKGEIKNPAFVKALEQLGRALVALEPYTDDLVVIGGMVPFLWKFADDLGKDTLPHIATTEVDVSIRPRLELRGGSVRERLEAADFVVFERPGYRDAPGAICFRDKTAGADKRSGSYIEFLTPLRGRGEKTLIEVQPGLRAEALRYLDLLAFEAKEISLTAVPELHLKAATRVRVPQPATFVAQKILARSSGRLKKAEKAAKDLAYVFYAARISRPQWEGQARVLARAAKEAQEWARWIGRAGRELKELFETATSEGPIEAGRIYRDVMGDAAPSDDDIQRVVAQFVDATFGAAK